MNQNKYIIRYGNFITKIYIFHDAKIRNLDNLDINFFLYIFTLKVHTEYFLSKIVRGIFFSPHKMVFDFELTIFFAVTIKIT